MNKICKEYGHSWRFETINGKHVRTCENCGAHQSFIIFDDDCWAWCSKEESE